ncbi:DUF7882 family protein [Agrococcus sp. SGAir0287]|uniref:DUF7882 family protein n=1 Tax=Agrococcus sp. SGAir0287 TaxID=2070347 RepID=UPI0010CCB344|nr:hypothetical protein [Agrococcus sp. SGAir0287]QCR20368.1 hypothetical protein C1N71_13710 [Agrococcus sp. SGAir0287]
MGTLHYGSTAFELEDEALRHFSAVMVAKLRRGEPFLALVRSDAEGLERIWVHTAADIRIATMPTREPLDQQRLQHMVAQANKGGVDVCEAWMARVAA